MKSRVMGTVDERFLDQVDVQVPGCWLWTGRLDRDGYAVFSQGTRGSVVRGHRWAYERWIGPIPEGLTIDHLCHDPKACMGGISCPHRRCVNPWHVEPATSRDNTLRGGGLAAVNAIKTHCDRGHPFDEANTYERPHGGGRYCRACGAQSHARRRVVARG